MRIWVGQTNPNTSALFLFVSVLESIPHSSKTLMKKSRSTSSPDSFQQRHVHRKEICFEWDTQSQRNIQTIPAGPHNIQGPTLPYVPNIKALLWYSRSNWKHITDRLFLHSSPVLLGLGFNFDSDLAKMTLASQSHRWGFGLVKRTSSLLLCSSLCRFLKRYRTLRRIWCRRLGRHLLPIPSTSVMHIGKKSALSETRKAKETYKQFQQGQTKYKGRVCHALRCSNQVVVETFRRIHIAIKIARVIPVEMLRERSWTIA